MLTRLLPQRLACLRVSYRRDWLTRLLPQIASVKGEGEVGGKVKVKVMEALTRLLVYMAHTSAEGEEGHIASLEEAVPRLIYTPKRPSSRLEDP